jgi:hypothetical protein
VAPQHRIPHDRIVAAFEAPALVAGIDDFAVLVTRPSSAVVILKNSLGMQWVISVPDYPYRY